MRSHINSSPDDIDIGSLWSVLKRSGPKLLGVSALVGLATLAGLSLVPSRYTSEAQLQIGGQGVNDPFRDPRVGNTPTVESLAVRVDKEAIASQVIALRSRDLATKLAAELKLNARPEFNSEVQEETLTGRLMRMAGLSGPRPGETEEERVLAAYYKALQVFQVRDTRVITIEFSARDTDLAARAANRLAELYQEWLRSQGVTQTEDASQWLRPQVEKLTREVAEVEAEVERFRSQANLFRGGGATNNGLNEQQLTDLTSELTRSRTARSEADARARSARELMQRGSVDAIPEVQKSPVIQGLIAQRTRAEREKAEAETSLLAGHPRMKQLNANVTDLRRQVLKEAQVIVEGLEKEAKSLAFREDSAVKILDDMKARVGSTAGDVARLASLEGNAKAKRRELETLQASLQAAISRGGDVRSVPLEAQVISKARPSTVPSSPKRLQFSSLASAAALILGLAFIILKELFSSARRGGASQPMAPAPVAHVAAPLPVNAKAARAPASAAVAAAVAPAPATVVASRTPAAAKSSMDSIASRLVANAGEQGGYRTVITGSADGVSIRDEAVDLAAALVKAGRQIALVDWSETGSGFAEALGLTVTPGIIDLLEGDATFEDIIRRLPDSDVHVIPSGSARSSSGAIDADRVNLVLDALDEAYDQVVVAGDHAEIRDLFLAIQGRFDAGVIVSDGQHTAPADELGDGMFLGFQVSDIDVIHLDRGGEPPRRRRMQLARSGAAVEARS